MAENEGTPVEGAEGAEGTEVKTDTHEEKARPKGWRPLEEWDGDPEEWVDAKEFIRRVPLFEKNHKLSKKVKDLEKTLFELKGHMGKVGEAAYNKAVNDLMAQRDAAIDDGDKEQVKAIDKAIKEAETLKPDESDKVHPAITAWEADNGEWFYKDQEIADFGMAYFQRYLARSPGKFEEGLEAMETAIKKAYPEKFENPKRKAPPVVEAGAAQGAKKKYTRADLSDDQRKVMGNFVRQGIMSEEDYIKQLVEIGEVGGKK